jgi:CBS domain-containing protein
VRNDVPAVRIDAGGRRRIAEAGAPRVDAYLSRMSGGGLAHSVPGVDEPAPIGSYLTPSFEHAQARDAMRPAVFTCDPAAPLVTVVQRMAAEHVHAFVVRAEPWAVLTDRDVLRCADRMEELTAGEAATGELLRVAPDDRLADVREQMLEHAVSHALVVDPATDRPVGVVSTLDVAGILAWGRG